MVKNYQDHNPEETREWMESLQALIDGGARVVGVRTPWRRQVSSPGDLLEMTRWMLEKHADEAVVATSDVGAGCRLEQPLRIDPGVRVGDHCRVGPHVYLERGCRLGDGVKIRNAVVTRGTVIASGSRVEGRVCMS